MSEQILKYARTPEHFPIQCSFLWDSLIPEENRNPYNPQIVNCLQTGDAWGRILLSFKGSVVWNFEWGFNMFMSEIPRFVEELEKLADTSKLPELNNNFVKNVHGVRKEIEKIQKSIEKKVVKTYQKYGYYITGDDVFPKVEVDFGVDEYTSEYKYDLRGCLDGIYPDSFYIIPYQSFQGKKVFICFQDEHGRSFSGHYEPELIRENLLEIARMIVNRMRVTQEEYPNDKGWVNYWEKWCERKGVTP